MHTAFLQLGLACSSCHRGSICDDDRMFSCSHVPYRGIIRSLCVKIVGKEVEENAESHTKQDSLGTLLITHYYSLLWYSMYRNY